jgi:hypothetical protein
MDTGLWQCFKTKESGNIVHLVSFMEGISYSESLRLFSKKMLDSPELLFSKPKEVRQKHIKDGYKTIKDEKRNFIKITEKSKTSDIVTERLASAFIESRKLTHYSFYVGVRGKFVNRLIIPYTWNGHMEYFQARQLTNYGMKYLNPASKEYGIKSSDILFPFNEQSDTIIVTEGPLDAISLQGCGLNATSTQGSILSHNQLSQMSGMKIILAYDNDDSGKSGIKKAAELLKFKNLPSPFKVQPPTRYKDWGDFCVDASKEEVASFIQKNVKKVDFYTDVNEELN